MAPTDDSFTIIVPGPGDEDRDGPAFIGDPDMGFSGLKAFGPNLIHHTQVYMYHYWTHSRFSSLPSESPNPAVSTSVK